VDRFGRLIGKALLSFLLLVASGRPTAAVDRRPLRNVLVLFPFNSDLPYVLLAEKTFRDEVAVASDLRLFPYYEHLDLLRFPDRAHREAVIDLLRLKYRPLRIDLVVIANESMLDLWLEHRAAIAPEAPVVFFDINIDRLAGRELPPGVYGIGAKVDHRPTLEWLLSLPRPPEEIAVVIGAGSADRIFRKPVEDLVSAAKGKTRTVVLSDRAFPDMLSYVAGMKPGSVVIFHILLQDAAGTLFAPLNALKEVAAASPVPVFVGYDHFVGVGTVGGYTYSIESQTREAARLGFSILRGERVDATSMDRDAGNRFVFDHAALKRFGYRLSDLPASSLLKNRQLSLRELYPREIAAVATVVAMLVLLAAVLALQTRNLIVARRALIRSNTNLESQVSLRTADLTAVNDQLRAEITERSRVEQSLSEALAERGILLKELNHRIKNNLQIVLSLIRMSTASDDCSGQEVLNEAAGRIEAIANVHEAFDADDASMEIDLDDYLVRLAVDADEMWAGQSSVAVAAKAETGLAIPMKTAATVGLIVNELVTNAFKYAYPGGQQGTIYVRAFKAAGGEAVVEVADEGVGMDPTKKARPESLGMSIVHSLAEGLGATLELTTSPGKGTRWSLALPL
jgi:two-component sensor histidine kinase